MRATPFVLAYGMEAIILITIGMSIAKTTMQIKGTMMKNS